jgi:anti-anti-sigma regulatory factor
VIRVPRRTVVKSKSKPKAKAKGTAARTITLPAQMALPQAATLKSELKRALSCGLPVTLDATAVTRVDAAMLQLLSAFVRDRQLNDRGVVWQGVPACVEDAAQRLGLGAALAVARA